MLAGAILVVGGALAACGPAEASPSASVVPSAQASPPPSAAPASASASPAASPSTTVESAAPPTDTTVGSCAADALDVSAGPLGGAAGSRGADVTVTNSGQAPCTLSLQPVVAAVDPVGSVFLQNRPALGANGPTLEPGGTATFSVVMSNWCDADASLPIALRLVLAGGVVDIGGLSIATTDDLPPCNGPDQPPVMTATDWAVG
jgi:hypothetical protein